MKGNEHDYLPLDDADVDRTLSALGEAQRALTDAEEREFSLRYDRVRASLSTWVRNPAEQVKSPVVKANSGRQSSRSIMPANPVPSRVQQAFGWTFAVLGIVGFAIAGPHVMKAFRSEAKQNPEIVEYVTHRAQRIELSLPDGSHVILAPDSRLAYRDDPDGSRAVDLTGQAYFSVTHNPNHPFSVTTESTTTRVLGTTFIVRSYSNESVAQIAVAEGKISVEAGVESKLLLAGDVGQIEAGKSVSVIHNATIADVFGWTRGQLTFDNALLRDVIVELERTYDLHIHLADSKLGQRRVTAVFSDQSAADMLIALTGVADMTYTRMGNRITLSPQ